MSASTPPLPSADVSCIIPTHDRPELLERALRSVAAQTTAPTQIIVADDLGLARTREDVARLAADLGITLAYVDTRPDHGRSTAGRNRNGGAAVATGDFLAFLDDDDVWDPRFLELTLARIDRSTDLVASWLSNVRGDLRSLWLRPAEGNTADDVLYNAQISGSNFVVRADAFHAIDGFDPRLRVKNDNDFMVRFLDAGHIYAVVPISLVDRHSHDLGHLTGSGRARYDGLQLYLDIYGERMSRAQHRQMRRVMHSALRGPDSALALRVYHSAAQLALTSPRELAGALRFRKIFGRQRMFN
ncbi:glycosyltransferase family 2 protein [Flexivirga sp. B27]